MAFVFLGSAASPFPKSGTQDSELLSETTGISWVTALIQLLFASRTQYWAAVKVHRIYCRSGILNFKDFCGWIQAFLLQASGKTFFELFLASANWLIPNTELFPELISGQFFQSLVHHLEVWWPVGVLTNPTSNTKCNVLGTPYKERTNFCGWNFTTLLAKDNTVIPLLLNIIKTP